MPNSAEKTETAFAPEPSPKSAERTNFSAEQTMKISQIYSAWWQKKPTKEGRDNFVQETAKEVHEDSFQIFCLI